MSASYCLLGFAQRINAVARDEWKAIIDSIPEQCDKGCGQSCREVCKRYARMQWHLVGGVKSGWPAASTRRVPRKTIIPT